MPCTFALAPSVAISLLLVTASCVADHIEIAPVTTPLRATALPQDPAHEMHRLPDEAKRTASHAELPAQF
jgi:hypothetical protein